MEPLVVSVFLTALLLEEPTKAKTLYALTPKHTSPLIKAVLDIGIGTS
tara:strand:+ start:394 stop:537 length:144 start_codon:yes stop_codon:yes gene_type:complete